MKGCLSLLMALLVLAALIAGGYWLYTDMKGRAAVAGGGIGTSLTLVNETTFPLIVTLTKDQDSDRIQVMPGKTAKRPMEPGTYQVQGTIADANTTEFAGEWTIERGMNYTANFVRSGGEGGGEIQLLVVRGAPPAAQ